MYTVQLFSLSYYIEMLCAGYYGNEGDTYNITCTGNLLPTDIMCSINGQPHPCTPGKKNVIGVIFTFKSFTKNIVMKLFSAATYLYIHL